MRLCSKRMSTLFLKVQSGAKDFKLNMEISQKKISFYIYAYQPDVCKPLEILFLQTHATIYQVQLLYTVKAKGGKLYPLPYGLRNLYRNLESEKSQDYAQKPQRNCTFMNLASEGGGGGGRRSRAGEAGRQARALFPPRKFKLFSQLAATIGWSLHSNHS